MDDRNELPYVLSSRPALKLMTKKAGNCSICDFENGDVEAVGFVVDICDKHKPEIQKIKDEQSKYE